MLLGLCIPRTGMAQSIVLDLENAVAIALANNPGIKASIKSVEKQEALKKSAIDFTDTKFNYTRGELNSRIIDYEFQVSQTFKLNYGAQYNLQKEKVKLSQMTVNVSQAELIRRVRMTFILWDIAYKRFDYILSLDSIYSNFANAAEIRYRTGESNMLERTTAIGKQQEVSLSTDQARSEVVIYQQILGKLLNTTDTLLLNESGNNKLTNIVPNSADFGSNAKLNMVQQQVALAEQFVSSEKSKFIPSLSMGYINQQIDGVKNHGAFTLGVSMPIFFWAKQGQAQAAKIGVEVAKANYENNVLLFSAKYQELENNFRNYDRQVNYYETQGLALAEELIKFGTLGYESGDIGYVEYINNINQATDIQLNYLASLKNLNLTSIELLNILGQ